MYEIQESKIKLEGNKKLEVMILPVDYGSKNSGIYNSTAISLKKDLSEVISIDFSTKPESLLEQRSSEWFGPAIAIAYSLYENKELLSILIEGVISHLNMAFQGKSEPSVKLDIVVTKTEAEAEKNESVVLRYNGNVAGLRDIHKISKDLFSEK